MKKACLGGLAAAVLALLPLSARADSVADFYKGKKITMYIGYSVGGGYDVYARLLARSWASTFPAIPTIVPKNMTGAGSLVLANCLYNVAPKDGTAFGEIGRGIPLRSAVRAQARRKFDASKFNWIGSMNDEVSVCVAWQGIGRQDHRGRDEEANWSSAAPAPAPTPISSRRSSTACSAPSSRSSPAIPAATKSTWQWSAARCKGRCGWSWSSVDGDRTWSGSRPARSTF